MFYPCTAFVAFLVRSTARLALVFACLWSTRIQAQPPVVTKNDRPTALPNRSRFSAKL